MEGEIWYEDTKFLILITHLNVKKESKSLIREMIGAEIDFIVIEYDSTTNIAIASRTLAMKLRKELEIPKLKVNDVVRVRIVAIARKYVIIDLYGMEVTLPADNLKHSFIVNAKDYLICCIKTSYRMIRYMELKNKETKIINFIEDFGCISEEQLKVLFDCSKSEIKNILHSHFINKKGDIFVHKQKSIDKKIIDAIDVLCEHKGDLSNFIKTLSHITFLSKSNKLIVSEKADEKGIVKILKNKPSSSWHCDKLILLFEDTERIDKIKTDLPFLYCTYPLVEIIYND